MKQPKYPIGIQTFSQIIEEGYVYVDKTRFVYNLATQGKYYFLSRPRRFGKSLLMSTFEAFFRGQKELFKGLYIENQDWDWIEYPVLHLALNGQNYNSVADLTDTLDYYLSKWEKEYGIARDESLTTTPVRFARLIESLYNKTGRKVVILIDEYDQPLLQNIEQGEESRYEQMREYLQGFYSVIKAQDAYIRFACLTGISKFSKVSVFSGLNNLQDISLDPRFNAICGISETELLEYFGEDIPRLAEACEMTPDETQEKLRKEYDGYHFAKTGEGIYNPFSILNTFKMLDFSHYWIETGTPAFLIRILEKRDWDLTKISGSTCTELDLKGSDRYLTNPIPLLFQSGYLTIKGYDKRFRSYTLGYPNEEVLEGFTSDLLRVVSCNKNVGAIVEKFVGDVEHGRAEEFMQTLQSLMADVPYDLIVNAERHYQNMMYLIMKLMGIYTQTEYRTSNGRIDMLVKTDRYIYIMEFKLHGTVEEALAQIKDKDYVAPFRSEGKEIILIGAAFSAETRRLDSWLIEQA